ncbi:hypothetical protein SMD44_04032 [Streptomyces alboflavus]|uniref:Uncharacterized protein n=1 Tax=Streptomyces alboflavus TaxID=67267 RepID=A0A1Z1WDV4_9ACTN|nr:hypothetical protein SMD44_04032 [Streptomyces alboflavus]
MWLFLQDDCNGSHVVLVTGAEAGALRLFKSVYFDSDS